MSVGPTQKTFLGALIKDQDFVDTMNGTKTLALIVECHCKSVGKKKYKYRNRYQYDPRRDRFSGVEDDGSNPPSH